MTGSKVPRKTTHSRVEAREKGGIARKRSALKKKKRIKRRERRDATDFQNG